MNGELKNILVTITALYSKVLTWYFSKLTKENHREQKWRLLITKLR